MIAILKNSLGWMRKLPMPNQLRLPLRMTPSPGMSTSTSVAVLSQK